MTNTLTQKQLLRVQQSPAQHWVGDGFPVRTVLSYSQFGASVSPFLLLDYAGPAEIAPSNTPRGVGEHPHRGFETVTLIYQGEVEHRDSAGNHGRIGPGDVQWMTAASGVVHEEKYSREFTERGGTLEMVQLWVNLTAKDKRSPPAYQTLLKEEIPTVQLPHGAGAVRVIAGEFAGTKGPARTFTPVNVWDIRLNAGQPAELNVPEGFTTSLLVLHGAVTVQSSEKVTEGELALFELHGEGITVEASTDAVVLVLSGQPIEEPIIGYGPFVMNTQEEIGAAIQDYRTGKMGHLR